MQWLPVILILPYFFILLKIYRGLLGLSSFNTSGYQTLFVSIIIACRNEELKLPFLLSCLAEQDYPNRLFEVIVVDDNSSDNTRAVASSFSALITLFTTSNKGSGKKHAIKTGVEAASGELIITTDADCLMEKAGYETLCLFMRIKSQQ